MRHHRTRALLAALALFAACGGTNDSSATPADEALTRNETARPKIRVSLSTHLSWAPILIALEEGDFAAEGLDVELVPAMRSEESLVALVSGDIDVRPGPLSAGVMSAIAQGAPIRITAGMGVLDSASCTYYGIVPRRGLDTSGTPRVARIRASSEGTSRYVVHRMLAQRGIRLETLETVRLPDAVVMGSLDNGAVDLVAVSEPALQRVARSHGVWLAGERAVPGFQWGVLTYGERLWKREPELGIRFMRAYRRGLTRYGEGRTPRNVDIIARGTDEEPQVVRDACWLAMPTHARINWSAIADFQRWANAEGLMERTVSEAQAWDSTFVRASDR